MLLFEIQELRAVATEIVLTRPEVYMRGVFNAVMG